MIPCAKKLFVDENAALLEICWILPGLDRCFDDVGEFTNINMQRVREESPTLTRDYRTNLQSYAKWGDSDLELGFRSIEEIEEAAEKERLASRSNTDGDLPSRNLAISQNFISPYDETVTPASKAGKHRFSKELRRVRHVLFS